jgi:hypothetical protein
LLTTLVRFDENCDTFEKEWKKKSPLSSTTLINRFEGSCGTFGEQKKPNVIIAARLICPWKENKITLC